MSKIDQGQGYGVRLSPAAKPLWMLDDPNSLILCPFSASVVLDSGLDTPYTMADLPSRLLV